MSQKITQNRLKRQKKLKHWRRKIKYNPENGYKDIKRA